MVLLNFNFGNETKGQSGKVSKELFTIHRRDNFAVEPAKVGVNINKYVHIIEFSKNLHTHI